MKKASVWRKASGILFLAAMILMIIGAPPPLLTTAEEENGFTYSVWIDIAEITGYTGSEADLIIPDTLGGYPVTSIKDNVFADHTEITGVTFPESLVTIGNKAFSGCSGLTAITFPNSTATLGEYAFANCTALQRVSFGTNISKIKRSAFSGCSALTAVHVADIDRWCAVEFADSSANPLSYAHTLYLDQELVTEITLSDGVTAIKNYAFYACTSLQSITFPDSLAKIGNAALYGCTNLSKVTFGNGLTSVGSYVFAACTSLQTLSLPSSLTKITMYAFSGCTALENVTLPDTLTEINICAFSDCSALQSITIPAAVTEIGSSAFFGCRDLKTVTFTGELPSSNRAFTGCTLTAYYPLDLWDSPPSEYIYEGSILWLSYCFEHEWDTDFTVDKEATCLEDGSKSIHCAKCDMTKEQTKLPSPGHTWDTDYTIDKKPTCTETGLKSIHCANCEYVKDLTEIPYTEHPWKANYTVDKEPTCTTTGSKSIHCSVCKATTNITEIPCAEHPWKTGFTVDREATCGEAGLQSIHCSVCTATKEQTEIAGPAHTFGRWQERIAPTVESTGEDYRVCTTCKGEATRVIDPLPKRGLLGDVNGDQTVNTTDARLILQYAVGKIASEALDLSVADVSGDEAVNTTDARLVLQKAVGKIAEFPAKPVYALRESWIVEDQWEFRVLSVEVHELCNTVANDMDGYTDEQVVIIHYQYKNLGYTGTLQDLYISSLAFRVFDEQGEAASIYACTHVDYPQVCVVGTGCSAQEDYVLVNDSAEIKLVVSLYTSNGMGEQQAIFALPVFPAT